MKKDNFIRLIARTDRPDKVARAQYMEACRGAADYAFTHWLGDNGQMHSKNASLIAACVKKRNEILAG